MCLCKRLKNVCIHALALEDISGASRKIKEHFKERVECAWDCHVNHATSTFNFDAVVSHICARMNLYIINK